MTRRIPRRTLLAAAANAAMLSAPAVRAQGAAGVALVIGNSKYRWEASLPNVRRDAPDIAKRFEAMGLRTTLLQDVGRSVMMLALDKFKASAQGARFAAFYFAGHGAAWSKDTYLVPIDADLANPDAVQALVPVSAVGSATSGAANRLLVYDNCRNNPADGWQELQAQRAAIVNEEQRAASNRKANTLVLFSTAAGRVALDGPAGENSPFAAALLRQLEAPSVDLRTLPARLRRDLLIATEGRQVLWDNNTYQQSFALAGAAGNAPANRSGWARNPALIVELAKAYAFVRESGLSLPEGLIAHRPAGGSRDGHKVGSFRYTANYAAGPGPQCLVVLSVDEGKTAELIIAGKGEKGVYWRFVTGDVGSGRIKYQPKDGSAHYEFNFTDANSGTMTQTSDSRVQRKGGGARPSYSAVFTRLD